MNDLIEKAKVQDVALEIYNAKAGTKAIDIRRLMVQLPEVVQALNTVENYIFAASTKTQIAELDDGILATKLAKLFQYIALDVGYTIPEHKDDWQYMQTRLFNVLKQYYSQLTLADIKLAFELATIGELDNFLPRDSQGNPDKKHYQKFNPDYFAKILGAYIKKQNEVIGKAYQALPEAKYKTTTPDANKYYHNYRQGKNRNIFLQYKYTGKLKLEILDDMFLYKWLQEYGLIDDVQIKEDDRRKAHALYMQRVANGMINQFTAFQVRRNGIESQEIDYPAFAIARKREIMKAFDRMITEEMQVDNYLNFI